MVQDIFAMAQQAPTAPAKSSMPEEVVELSPFMVSETEGTGYRVKDTIVGRNAPAVGRRRRRCVHHGDFQGFH